MGLFLPQRWRRQPTYPVKLRPEYEQKLICLYAPWASVLAGNNNPTYWTVGGIGSAPTRVIEPSGINTNFTTHGYLYTTSGLIQTYPYSVFLLGRGADVTTNKILFSSGNVSSVYQRTQLDINAGTIRQIDYNDPAVGVAVSSASLAANTLFSAAGVSVSSSLRYAYVNGAGRGADTTSVTLAAPTQTRIFATALSSTDVSGFAGTTPFVIALQMALSDAVIAEAHVAPYGVFFVPFPARRYFMPSAVAAASNSITVPAAA